MPDPTTDPAGEHRPGSQTRVPLTTDDVAKVAGLAMLELSDADLEMFTGQLDAVLDLAGSLDRWEVDDVPPTAHPFGLTNVFRPDVPAEPSETEADDLESMRAEAIAGGPDIEDGRFKVPPALGESP